MTTIDRILTELPVMKEHKERVVSYDELKRKAFAMARRGYVHNETSLCALQSYLQGYGILLSGGIGIGKSLFFKLVNPNPIAQLSFNRCFLWKHDTLEEWLREHRNEEVVLDDIGWDSAKGNNYGSQFETLQVVLDYRLTESKARTHATMNLTNDELIAKYDAHLVDRLYECCQCFRFADTESRREPQPNEVYLRNLAYAREMGRDEP